MIKIETLPTTNPLTGKSKWWGQPDMPEELDYPEITLVDEDGEEFQDPLTFICQIRLEDIAALDPERLLPHEGMLYFFGDLDYFFGNYDTADSPGMGLWEPEHFRVLYSPSCNDLHTHRILFDDGTPFGLPAEAISFSTSNDNSSGIHLLGKPYIEEVAEQMPNMLSLLQIDENDRWKLIFYDCGMLNFLISPEDLRNRRWDKVKCHLFSF